MTAPAQLTTNPELAGLKAPVYCAYWNYDATDVSADGAWSGDGIEVVSNNETHVECCSYHMTTFAILMEEVEEEPFDYKGQNMQYMSYGSYGTSIFCLLTFIFIILCNKCVTRQFAPY